MKVSCSGASERLAWDDIKERATGGPSDIKGALRAPPTDAIPPARLRPQHRVRVAPCLSAVVQTERKALLGHGKRSTLLTTGDAAGARGTCAAVLETNSRLRGRFLLAETPFGRRRVSG